MHLPSNCRIQRGYTVPTLITPGDFVRHPDCDDWGLGQVQSVIGNRITVNFEHAGKQLINAEVIALVPVSIDRPGD